MNRSSGVLLHISSLPSDYGIGTLGKEAYKFIDYLVKSGQSYWQILPIGHTSFGDSPYASFSAFAGNPYFIDLDLLRKSRLLKKQDYQNIKWSEKDDEVDYATLYERRFSVLKVAVKNFKDNDDYLKFVKKNKWLESYALFMSIKNKFDGASWLNWPNEYRIKNKETIDVFKKEYAEEIRFFMVIQYFFYSQWMDLKAYAKSKGIKIFGDCPFYVALDSSDVWENPELFKLDEFLIPTEVAGVPPDYFTSDGQLWGNPLYEWKNHKRLKYKWWIDRLNNLAKLFDVIRIDHFIGIDSYYAIKYGEQTAKNGTYHKGPGMNFIDTIKQKVKGVEIVAEDLGALTPRMRKLLKNSGYPGMKVLRFGFKDNNKNNEHLPHMYDKNTIAYVTSHDTETCMGWLNSTVFYERNFINEYFKITDYNNFNWVVINAILKSKASLAIIQAQDLLALNDNARMNFPSSLGGKNWKWRLNKGQLDSRISKKLKSLTLSANR